MPAVSVMVNMTFPAFYKYFLPRKIGSTGHWRYVLMKKIYTWLSLC